MGREQNRRFFGVINLSEDCVVDSAAIAGAVAADGAVNDNGVALKAIEDGAAKAIVRVFSSRPVVVERAVADRKHAVIADSAALRRLVGGNGAIFDGQGPESVLDRATGCVERGVIAERAVSNGEAADEEVYRPAPSGVGRG